MTASVPRRSVSQTPALDEAGGFEAVGEAGDAAAAEQQHAGEILHAHAGVGGVREAQEHLVPGEGHAAALVQVPLQRIDDRGVQLHEDAPGQHLLVEG